MRDERESRVRRATGRLGAIAAAVVAVWLAVSAPVLAQVLAQASPPGTNASAPTPVTESKGGGHPPDTGGSVCPARPRPGLNETATVLVTLDPETLWRPRGGEVRFTVSGKTGATVLVQRVQVCLGWSASPGAREDGTATHELVPSPIVRPIRQDDGASILPGGGGALFGATVPDLLHIGTPWWPSHPVAGAGVAFTAVDTVPVADMVVQVTLSDGVPVTVLVPVGVTSVTYAVVVVALCLGGFLLAAWIVVSRSSVPGRSVPLRMISSPNGYASLSQFQILLWTVTVGAAAVYVMVLSGNLINLTTGTLVLLGIAGAAALAARIPGSGSPQPIVTKQGPPAWSDLVVVGGSIDLTRVQMLVFTLISAAFVMLKVIVGYAIPDIPANFQLLMGISNGIYVAGRKLPDQPSTPVGQ